MKPKWKSKFLTYEGTSFKEEIRTAYCPCCDEKLEIKEEKCKKCSQIIDWKGII